MASRPARKTLHKSGGNRRRGLRIAAGLLAVSLASPAVAGTDVCASADEQTALAARVLQSDLMVAALTCQQQASYNAFVYKFRSELVSRSQTVKAYFARTQGRNATRALNAFVTRMANEASMRSLQVRGYCDSVPARFDETLASSPAEFDLLLARFPERDAHGEPACRPAPTQEARLGGPDAR